VALLGLMVGIVESKAARSKGAQPLGAPSLEAGGALWVTWMGWLVGMIRSCSFLLASAPCQTSPWLDARDGGLVALSKIPLAFSKAGLHVPLI
jgi:hypothetical protein